MHTLFRLDDRSLLRLQGEGVFPLLKRLLCGDVRALQNEKMLFSPMLNLQGGTMDVVFVLREPEDCFWMIVHENSREKDLRHIRKHLEANADVQDCAEAYQLYALLGPDAERLMESAPVFFKMQTSQMGAESWLACVLREEVETFETDMAQRGVMLHSHSELDMLMMESGVAAYGRELDDTINPLEAGLGRYVRLERSGFVGREALVAAGEPRRGVIGLEVERYGARHGQNVVHRDKDVGMVTSACYSDRLKKHIALALVEKPYQDIGRKLKVECGDELITAHVSALPFKAGEAEQDGEATEEIKI